MGRQYVNVEWSAIVSRHNTEQDEIDDFLWEDFVKRVWKIAAEAKYKGIHLE